MYCRLVVVVSCILLSAVNAAVPTAKETKIVSTTLQTGELIMDKFLEACPAIADLKPSARVHPGIVGEVIDYNGQSYEIRVQSFEDTMGNIPDMTFREYVTKYNLRPLKSNMVHPLPNISFESFDFRHAELNDGVYFTIVLRKI